jgi:hypothetical protein
VGLEKVESHLESFIELADFQGRQRAHIARQIDFPDADEVIAHDPAVVLQAFVRTDRDLSGEAIGTANKTSFWAARSLAGGSWRWFCGSRG